MIEAICATIFAVVILVSLIRFYKGKKHGSIMVMIAMFLIAVTWASLSWVAVLAVA